MRASQISAALVAALVGYAASVAIVIAAGQAVGATPAQIVSWVAAVSIAKGIGSALLSRWTLVPVVLAWSTPGAALIATSTGISLPQAAGGFFVAGILIFLTGLLPFLNRWVSAIPMGIAAGMLAGVLLPFVTHVAVTAADAPNLVLPLVACFLVVRRIAPLYATLATMALAIGIAVFSGNSGASLTSEYTLLTSVHPEFTWAAAIGLGMPLYLVTMASQNLPGFAVMRANGFTPPTRPALVVTGLGSAMVAFFGAHTFNMAAITAAICLDPEVEPDRARRWRVGLAYGVIWVAIGLASPLILPLIAAIPPALIGAVAGLALIGALIGAITQAYETAATRFPATLTLAVTASGTAAFGLGSAFWGLCIGLLALGLDRLAAKS
ncbi:MAG: benzoate transporter BenE [Rhodobacteraceae bacterium]|nr:benzoate transporter BenE [Paracoccaceae bacterium]